jgi:hypothetical protein
VLRGPSAMPLAVALTEALGFTEVRDKAFLKGSEED